jgi:hypothetical protein
MNSIEASEIREGGDRSLAAHALTSSSGLIESFSITTDSVVATARFKLRKEVRHFQIDWGDDQFSSGSNRLRHHGLSNTSDDGALILTHVYEEPDNRAAFEKYILLKAWDKNGNLDFSYEQVSIVPRYWVIHNPIYFYPNSFNDFPAFENDEYLITMHSLTPELTFHKQWKCEWGRFRSTGHVKMEGSRLSHELVLGESFLYHLDIKEMDPVFDDDIFSTRIRVDVTSPTGKIVYDRKLSLVYFHRSVILLAPLPPTDSRPIGE